MVGGLFNWRNAPGQTGADLPAPTALSTAEPGIRANVHVGSLLGSLTAGVYERDLVRSVENLMVVIKEVPPGTPPREGIEITKNVDFATFAKRLAESRKPKPGTPKTTVFASPQFAPSSPLEFSLERCARLLGCPHS